MFKGMNFKSLFFWFLGAIFFAQMPLGAMFLSENGSKNEEILRTFDIPSEFLNSPLFFEAREEYMTERRQKYLISRFEGANEFIPTLREMFLKEGVPQEILFLAMTESEFSLTARSNKKAVGIWQFMPKTAEIMGLKINKEIDERRDPIKSTAAAIAYLKELKADFGKWYLAAIAYNCGKGRLSRAIISAKSDDINILLDPKKGYIPKESRQYIKKILSVSMFFRDSGAMGDYEHFLNRGANSSLASIVVPNKTSIERIARKMGKSPKELMRYNSQYKGGKTPSARGDYSIYMPYEWLANYLQRNHKIAQIRSDVDIIDIMQTEEIKLESSANSDFSEKLKKRLDAAKQEQEQIAQKNLELNNNLQNAPQNTNAKAQKSKIQVFDLDEPINTTPSAFTLNSQNNLLPQNEAIAKKKPTSKATTSANEALAQFATPQNTTYKLSAKSSGSAPKNYNHQANSGANSSGASFSGAKEKSTKYKSYIVKSGDTAFSIARANNSTPAELARLNGIADITKISIGQELKIPLK